MVKQVTWEISKYWLRTETKYHSKLHINEAHLKCYYRNKFS